MRMLVIPDVHLKPWMFQSATNILRAGKADSAVCLMDLADDWNKQWQLELYQETYDAAIQFAREHPASLWCYGNHDVCYEWQFRETGYSPIAAYTVCTKLNELRSVLPKKSQIAFVQRVDNVLFSHGGLLQAFVEKYVPNHQKMDVDAILRKINRLHSYELWRNESPLWYRPEYGGEKFGIGKYFQVAGHTPQASVNVRDGLLLCDVFSTKADGTPIGDNMFAIIDTVSGEYETVPGILG